MKKLLALLLSVMMAASLAVPAFADGPDGPAPDGYDGQVEAAPISAILDESIGIIGGADGPTSIITSGPLGAMDWEDYLYLPEGTTVEDWAKLLEQQAQAQRDEIKKTLGGVPGQIGVMVNGAYIQFPDAAPEVTDGRTMVPVRALVEALGGEVDYEFADQKDSVRLFIDKYAINFTVGGTTAVRHTRGTDTGEADKTIEMDCAPYIKGGRTYVPVRFIAEALGYEVGWDGEYETAILVDREALAAEIDEQFTILNRVQANRNLTVEEGKSLREDLKASATFTAFDTLNGNKTYQADLTGKALLNSEAASGDCVLTLSDSTIDLLLELMELDGADAEIMRDVLEGLKDIQVIVTKEGKVWIHAAALDVISEEKNLWFGADMGAEFGELLFSSTGGTTMGTVIAAMASTDSVEEWPAMEQAIQMMTAFYGDDNFTTANGTSTLTIGMEELADLYADYGLALDDWKEVYKECEITMKVDSKGGAAVTCVMETSTQSGLPGMKLTMDCTQSGGKVDLTMDLHIANMGELKLTMNTTQQSTSEKPMTEPPEGATVVDNSTELLNP